MALNLSEQLRVQSGELKPNAVDDLLIDLAKAAAINYARDFNPSHKEIVFVDPNNPTVDEQNANNYLAKMLRATNGAITNGGAEAFNNTIASYIALNPASSEAAIQGATLEQWESFILGNIDEAVELFAGVKVEEKTAYDNY